MADAIDDKSELERIKQNIKDGYLYFQKNNNRYHESKRFVFETTLTASDITVLQQTDKPTIECNIMEAYISRLRGEFSKHVPSVEVTANPGRSVEPDVVDVVDGHLRYILEKANNDNLEYNIYTDILAGGYSVMKVHTQYDSPMSFDQNIVFSRTFEPSMCCFDPFARNTCKDDGRYCAELFPKTEEELKEMGIDTSKISYRKDLEGFSWSYKDGLKKVALLANYYEKEVTRTKIVQLMTGEVMTLSDYHKFLKQWEEEGLTAQPPKYIGKPRTTELTTVIQYLITENQIIEKKKTSYSMLPLVFVDGNSVLVRNSDQGSFEQITRPYVYNAKGVQKLLNFSFQTLGNELENMVQHKFKVAKQAIPQEYLAAYENYQIPNVLIYNAYNNDDPDQPLPPPQEIMRPPIPPEISQTFMMMGQAMQSVLGNFEAELGKLSGDQISGIAVQELVTLSNSASMPYVVNFMQALTKCAQIAVDLIPKYFVTPRTLPIKGKDGVMSYIEVNRKDGQGQNAEGSVSLDYQADILNVNVKAGPNFSVQKSKALQQITMLMQVSEEFKMFMAAKGMPILLDNIDIRGVDQLREMAMEFGEEMKAKQEQEQQQQQIQLQMMQQQLQAENPQIKKLEIEQEKVVQQAEQHTADLHFKVAEMEQKLRQSQQEFELRMHQMEIDKVKILADAHERVKNSDVQLHKADTERYKVNVEAAMTHADRAAKHALTMEDRRLASEEKTLQTEVPE